MTRPGYIYALINYSMPGLIKVGFTTRSAEERATELSAATAVPTPFVVAYDILVPDGAGGERRIHERLEEQGYRVSDDREFFNAPLRRIIGAMIAVREELSGDRFEWDVRPPVTEPTIAEPISSSEVRGFVDDQQPVGKKVLEAILQAGARVDVPNGPAQTFAVGELVDIVRPSKAHVHKNDLLIAARDWMNWRGMRIREVGGQEVLFLANQSKWIRDALKETPYADGWRDSLKSVEGVVVQGPQITFHSGLSSRTVGVPLTLLTVQEEED